MNHKELIATMATKLNLPKTKVEELMSITVGSFTERLSQGVTIGIQSFGSLEVRKKEERLSVHPSTKIRTLIPPKLVVNFKQSTVLKDKFKDLPHHD
jgi:DNA-binding protein HU-beta